MIDDNDKKEIEKMIDFKINLATRFSKRKLGDMPTDNQQLTPRGYVNLNGTRADRPTSPIIGQQYFSTQDNFPWFTDGVSSWFSASGSIVSAI